MAVDPPLPPPPRLEPAPDLDELLEQSKLEYRIAQLGLARALTYRSALFDQWVASDLQLLDREDARVRCFERWKERDDILTKFTVQHDGVVTRALHDSNEKYKAAMKELDEAKKEREQFRQDRNRAWAMHEAAEASNASLREANERLRTQLIEARGWHGKSWRIGSS